METNRLHFLKEVFKKTDKSVEKERSLRKRTYIFNDDTTTLYFLYVYPFNIMNELGTKEIYTLTSASDILVNSKENQLSMQELVLSYT